MNERIFPTSPGNTIECNFTHLANNSTFSNKTTPTLKGNPNFTELKQVIPPLTFFLSKSAQNTKWCVTPVKKNMRHLYLKMTIPTKTQKCEQNFSFGLNVGVFLKQQKALF
jgi:hypothetical protein